MHLKRNQSLNIHTIDEVGKEETDEEELKQQNKNIDKETIDPAVQCLMVTPQRTMSVDDTSESMCSRNSSRLEQLDLPELDIKVIERSKKRSEDNITKADRLIRQYATRKSSGKTPGHYNLIQKAKKVPRAER